MYKQDRQTESRPVSKLCCCTVVLHLCRYCTTWFSYCDARCSEMSLGPRLARLSPHGPVGVVALLHVCTEAVHTSKEHGYGRPRMYSRKPCDSDSEITTRRFLEALRHLLRRCMCLQKASLKHKERRKG